MKRLEAFVEENAADMGALYDAACAYSLASEAIKAKDTAKSKAYADRAVALLKQAVSNGYSNYSHVQTDERGQDEGGLLGEFCANWLRFPRKIPSKSLIA